MNTVVGSFDRQKDVAETVDELVACGFARQDIRIVDKDFGTVDARSLAIDDPKAASLGAVAGGAIGGAAGVAASLLALALAGAGPMFGSEVLITALVGIVTGALAVGIVGALVDGIGSDTAAAYYADAVHYGSTLIAMRAEGSRAGAARKIMQRHGAYDVEDPALASRPSAWDTAGVGV